MYGFPANWLGKYRAHPSVIEFPMKTTRFSPDLGVGRATFESRKRRRFAQSVRSCSTSACAAAVDERTLIRSVARNADFIMSLDCRAVTVQSSVRWDT